MEVLLVYSEVSKDFYSELERLFPGMSKSFLMESINIYNSYVALNGNLFGNCGLDLQSYETPQGRKLALFFDNKLFFDEFKYDYRLVSADFNIYKQPIYKREIPSAPDVKMFLRSVKRDDVYFYTLFLIQKSLCDFDERGLEEILNKGIEHSYTLLRDVSLNSGNNLKEVELVMKYYNSKIFSHLINTESPLRDYRYRKLDTGSFRIIFFKEGICENSVFNITNLGVYHKFVNREQGGRGSLWDRIPQKCPMCGVNVLGLPPIYKPVKINNTYEKIFFRLSAKIFNFMNMLTHLYWYELSERWTEGLIVVPKQIIFENEGDLYVMSISSLTREQIKRHTASLKYTIGRLI